MAITECYTLCHWPMQCVCFISSKCVPLYLCCLSTTKYACSTYNMVDYNILLSLHMSSWPNITGSAIKVRAMATVILGDEALWHTIVTAGVVVVEVLDWNIKKHHFSYNIIIKFSLDGKLLWKAFSFKPHADNTILWWVKTDAEWEWCRPTTS